MKKIKQVFLPLALMLLALMGCQKEDFSGMKAPKVLFMVDELTVDLNAAAFPQIVSVIHSEAGLVKVSEYILKEGGSEMLYQEPVVSFVNPNSFSINQMPLYTEDMIGYRIVAVDRGGKETVAELKLKITPLRDAPVVKFFVDNVETTEFTWEEGKPMPQIRLGASSQEELRGIVFSKVINRVETIVKFGGADTLRFTNNELAYSFNAADVGYDEIDVKTTALKLYVEAGDVNRLKRKIATLKVNVVEKPAPVITFDGGSSGSVNEFADKTISGNVAAVSNLTSVSFYRKKKSGDVLIETKTFDPAVSSHTFSYTITSADVQDQGLKVVATDKLNKTQTTTYNLTVVELAPAPTVTLNQNADFFNGLDVGNATLTGTISSGAGYQSITVKTKDYSGAILQNYSVTCSASDRDIALSQTVAFANEIRKLEVTAVDVNNKTTTVTRDVYVGYYYKRLLVSLHGSDAKTHAAGPIPGPFISTVPTIRALTYLEGLAEPGVPEMCVATWNANADVCVGNIKFGMNTNSSNKFTGYTIGGVGCGVNLWDQNKLTQVYFGSSSIPVADFDKSTVEDFTVIDPAPTSNSVSTRMTLCAGPVGNWTPSAVMKYINTNGKRVVYVYDGVATMQSQVTFSTFYVKVKVQK